MALEIFEAKVSPKEGLQMVVSARNMEFVLDEPEELGGNNTGMNPVEALLGTLGGCYGIVIRSFAENHQMKISDYNIRVEGDLDMDGFMGLNKEAKIGFEAIRIFIEMDADNTPEEIQNYIRFVERTCPVSDTIVNTPKISAIVNGQTLE